MSDLPEHVSRNRQAWDQLAASYEEDGERKWAAAEPVWGIFEVPESQVGMLPAALDGVESIELGCGTGYVSAWLARRGARPVGIDSSEAQLATAAALQRQHEIEFPLLHGNAEQVPLPDASFDLAISEYGASIWCDPYRWIPEASRLLRPGGELAFMVVEWEGEATVEFHLPHGELIALLRENGLQVEQLIEVRPPDGSTTRYPYMTLEWAQRWPCEEVWRARKVG